MDVVNSVVVWLVQGYLGTNLKLMSDVADELGRVDYSPCASWVEVGCNSEFWNRVMKYAWLVEIQVARFDADWPSERRAKALNLEIRSRSCSLS